MYRGALFNTILFISMLLTYQRWLPSYSCSTTQLPFVHVLTFLTGRKSTKMPFTIPKRTKDVKNLQKPMPKYRLAFREQDLGMLYKIKPLTDQSQITIFFQIPDYDLDSRYKFAPNDYFTSLIGHEGESKISI